MVITYEAQTPYGRKREYRVGTECIWSEYVGSEPARDEQALPLGVDAGELAGPPPEPVPA